MAGGGNTTSNRNLGEVFALFFAVGVVALEFYLVFSRWLVVVDKWIQRNPVTPILLCAGLAMGPVVIFMAVRSTGKRLGEEAEDIGRGMRR